MMNYAVWIQLHTNAPLMEFQPINLYALLVNNVVHSQQLLMPIATVLMTALCKSITLDALTQLTHLSLLAQNAPAILLQMSQCAQLITNAIPQQIAVNLLQVPFLQKSVYIMNNA
jgi:hypothetical protein